MIVDVLRREGDQWRYVCLIDRCGYASIPTTDKRAAAMRRIHRHRHLVGLAPIPWHPTPTKET